MSPSESVRASEFWGKEPMCTDFQCVQQLLCIVPWAMDCGLWETLSSGEIGPNPIGPAWGTRLLPRKGGWTEGPFKFGKGRDCSDHLPSGRASWKR